MTEEQSPSPWRQRAKRLGLGLVVAGVSGGLVLILLEIGVRISGVQPDFFFQLDPEVGAIHIPNKQGYHVFAEGKQRIEINRYGYRDDDWRLDKPGGVYRVAVLGDSFVEGFQVSLDDHFVPRVETELNARCTGAETVEVMNFGVSGFGNGQELATLRHRVLAFDPDVVLLFAYPSNDLFDNSREIDFEPNRLHFELADDGSLRRLPYYVSDHPVKRWLRHHSKAYLFVRDRIKRLGAIRRALIAARLMQQEVPAEEASATNETEDDAANVLDVRYQVPSPPPIERAWKLTEALLVEIRRTAEASGAAFGLLVAPNREEVLGYHPDRPDGGEGLDFDHSLRRMAGICERHAIRCLGLRDAFRAESVALDELYFPIDGHWTPRGHEVVARESVDWLTTWACPGSPPSAEPGA